MATQKQTQTAKTETPAIKQDAPATRFSEMVVKEFGVASIKTPGLTDFHKRLAQNYFYKLDEVLKTAEVNRLRKDEKKRDQLPVAWENINLESLARDVLTHAVMGLDPNLPNNVSLIPYKNSSTKKYDIGFIRGYRGLELIARKYALDIPDQTIVRIVKKNDHFKEIPKSANNPVENYEFVIKDSFNRGEIVGGFYYHIFEKDPKRNILKVLTLEDIEKRKPEYASVEFWGGEKPEWKDGKVTGKKIKVEGWFEEMCYKTIYRAAFNSITIDPAKIDENYHTLKQIERETISQLKLEDDNEKPNSVPLEPVNEPEKKELQDKESDLPPAPPIPSDDVKEPDFVNNNEAPGF